MHNQIEDIAQLRNELELYRSRALNAEARARLLEQELMETKVELKITLIKRHFLSSPAKSL